METTKLKYDPRQLIRMLLKMTYESNINQYNNSDEDLTGLKYATVDFLTNDGYMTDIYIDKICQNLADKDGNVEIKNDNNFRKALWKSFINSKEYLEYISKRPILETGVFNKLTKKEYLATFGNHFITILSILKEEKVEEENFDDYIENNLLVYGNNYSKFTPSEEDEELIELLKVREEVNKKEIVNDYVRKHWQDI